MTLQTRQDLMQVFAGVEAAFGQAKATVDEQEKRLFTAVEKIRQAAAIPRAFTEAGKNDFHRAILPFFQAIQEEVNDWIEGVRTYERQTEFHERFGDSLLIFAYGKVKAGKSSLGNYLAYGHSRPDDKIIKNATPKPAFFREAESGAGEENAAASGRFRVDALEATCTIQNFRLPGLTWVDVPGLDSLTETNGKLAQGYVQAADLVLFLTRSGSPMRASETEHLLTLAGQHKKPFAVVVTCCDTFEEDEVDGEIVQNLVMKPEEDLAAQKGWVREQLDTLPQDLREYLLSGEIHTISVRYAEEHPDEAGWRTSGMAGFAGQIAAIAEGEGLRLKRLTPLRNLRAFADKLHSSKQVLEKKKLRPLQNTLKQDRDRFTQVARRAETAILAELSTRLDQWVDAHAGNDEDFRKTVEKGVEELVKRHIKPVEQEIRKRLDGFEQQLATMNRPALDLPGFQKRTREMRRPSRRWRNTGRAGGAFLGAMIGSVFGPVGMIAGSAIGNVVGKQVGGYFDEDETVVIDLGDNRLEVRRQTREQIGELVRSEIRARIDLLDQVLYGAMEDWLNGLGAELAHLEKTLDAVGKHLATKLEENA